MIVVPMDFSACAKKAAQEALAFVQHFGGRMLFLHVLELPSAAAVGYGPTVGGLPPAAIFSPQDIEPEWQAFFAEFSSLKGVNSEYQTIEGRPISTIMETAEKQNADLIMMGNSRSIRDSTHAVRKRGRRSSTSSTVLRPNDSTGRVAIRTALTRLPCTLLALN
jgi:nucleotide-binding universal stress UspA family protein